MIRATIDTNVAVSGLLFGGIPLKILESAFEQGFTWVTSPDLLRELESVLHLKKFKLSQPEISDLTAPVLATVEIVVPQERIEVIERCVGDNRVLECAVDGQGEFIVTGDRRHLLSLDEFRGIQIIEPRKFINTLSAAKLSP